MKEIHTEADKVSDTEIEVKVSLGEKLLVVSGDEG